MNLPDELLYTKEHEWVKLDAKECTIGITDYAQNELGDIVFMELPDSELEVRVGDVAGTIEAVKTVADIYSPVNGKIIKLNEKLIDSPELINTDPYGDGWIAKIKIFETLNQDEFLSKEDYKNFIG